MPALQTAPQATVQRAECPECAAVLEANVTLPGEILDCAECGVELEVRSANPFTVALAPSVEEDWGE